MKLATTQQATILRTSNNQEALTQCGIEMTNKFNEILLACEQFEHRLAWLRESNDPLPSRPKYAPLKPREKTLTILALQTRHCRLESFFKALMNTIPCLLHHLIKYN